MLNIRVNMKIINVHFKPIIILCLLFCVFIVCYGIGYAAESGLAEDKGEVSSVKSASSDNVKNGDSLSDNPGKSKSAVSENTDTVSEKTDDEINNSDNSSKLANENSEPIGNIESVVQAAASSTNSPQTIEIVPIGNTGAASTQISIQAPPGRRGISPNLALKYSSSSRTNGWVGLGWSLDMGDIRRSGKPNVDYMYVSSGSTVELVGRSDPDWNGCYGAKIEGAFKKYCFISAENRWEVTSRNGVKYFYGSTADSRLNDNDGTFKWNLDKVKDLNGNFMEITYWKDPADLDNSDIYLDRIDYTGAADLDPSNYITFSRELRTDVTTLYTIGAQVISAYLLNRIDVFADNRPVRSYVLDYTLSPHSSRSLLNSVTTYGSDGTSALPSVVFSYQTSPDLFQLAGSIEIASDDYPKTVGDFNGDGRADFFTCKGRGLYSRGTTFYEAFSEWAGFNCNSHVTVSGDFNGDGRDDMIVFDTGSIFPDIDLFLSTGEDFVYTSTSFPSEKPVASGDFDGDGKDDFVSASGKIFYSTGSDFVYGGNQGLFGTDQVFSGDFNSNNDGKDEVLLDDMAGTAKLYISTGNTFELLDTVSADPVAAGDFNGDSTIDFIDADKNTHFSSGTGFDAPVSSNGLPAYIDNMLGGDFNGDGKDDVIIYNQTSGEVELYLSTGPIPDLLYAVDNGLGGTTDMSYIPSTHYNNTYLPFVVQTVSTVKVDDGNGNLSVLTQDYSGGYYDYGDREFRGFESVEKTMPNGSVEEIWYKQDDIFKGLEYEIITKDSAGNKYSRVYNTYDSTSPVQGVTVPYLSQRDDYLYDGSSTPRQSTVSFTYDSYGNSTNQYYFGDVDVTGDEKEVVTEYNPYDISNWLVSLPKTTYVKDENDTVKSQEWFTYYPNTSNLWEKTAWLENGTNPVTLYTYDSYGNIETIIDPNQYVKPVEDRLPITFTYDDTTHTYPVKVENQKSHDIEKTYDTRYGKVLTETDRNDHTTIYQYDVFGRIKKVINPNDTTSLYGTVTYYYLDFGKVGSQRVLSRTTEKSGTADYIWSEKYFDGHGRTIKTRSEGPDNKVIAAHTIYNEKGLADSVSLPYFEEIETPRYKTFDYDPVGRIIKTNYPDGTFESVSYLKESLTSIDANGHKKVQINDTYGRTVEIQDYMGQEPVAALYARTKYNYDVLGNLTDVWDDKNNNTHIEYDSLSRKKTMYDPDMGYWEYDYDANGNLTYQIDAELQVIRFEYDDLNRNNRKIYEGSTDPDVVYTYDQYDDASDTNAIGRLTKLTDKTGTTQYYYDKSGNSTKNIKTIDSIDYVTEAAFDALGRTETLTYPDGTVIKYEYNTAGNMSRITNETGSYDYATYSNYNAVGQYGQITYGNGVTTAYQYRPDNNRLSTMITNSPSAGELINLTYDYDGIGNITQILDSSNDLLGRSKTRDYKYDEMNRLIEAKSDSYGGALIYQYDSIGNMTYNCRVGYYFYEDADHVHAVTRIEKNSATVASYTYDNNGNMEAGAGRTYSYDYDNMPTSIISGGTEVVSIYGAHENRVKKIIPSQPTNTTVYIGDLYECKAGVCSKYIFAGPQRIAEIDNNDTYFYHSDHLGSNSIITDGAAGIAQEIYYYPFGEVNYNTGTDIAKHKYTDQLYDGETDLYYYGARYYDPKLARFTSADTIVPQPFDSQMLNRYSYVRNNPVLYVDPTGHMIFICCGGGDGGGGGGGGGGYDDGYGGDRPYRDDDDRRRRGEYDDVIIIPPLPAPVQPKQVNPMTGNFRHTNFFPPGFDSDSPFKGPGDPVASNDPFAAYAIGIGVGTVSGAYLLYEVGAVAGPYIGNLIYRYGSLVGISRNVSANFGHATQIFRKGPLTNVGRALAKHPNIIGESGNIVQKLGGAANVNKAAAAALKNIMQNGTMTNKMTKAFGQVIEYKLQSGLGARFSGTTGEFITFLGRGL